MNDFVTIYVLGHSLGTTDHEILREFLNLTEKSNRGQSLVRIIFLYHDEESKVNAIERVIEMIGKNALIERVHGNNWTIRFARHDDEQDGIMIPRL